MAQPLVAIVGRPNVGKSTLFNRLAGGRVAIVDDVAGTTRDRLYANAEWAGHTFALVDTGGLVQDPSDDLRVQVERQARQAIAEADVVVFLVDAKEGLTATDLEIGELLRLSAKPVLLAANKADNQVRRQDAAQFYQLGLGEVWPISALHGIGTGDLLDEVVAHLPPEGPLAEEEVFKVAIVGRPNVGKSSLLNAVLGQERVIVHPRPGTTRDAIDTLMEYHGQPLLLIDTAGLRRRGRTEPGVEKYGVLRALRAIGRADVVLLIMDAQEGVTAQDTHIAGYASEAGKGLVLVMNKWDLVKKADRALVAYTQKVREDFSFASYAPLLFVSAKTKEGLDHIMETALRVRAEGMKRVPTGLLNRIIGEALLAHSPPARGGRSLKILYATQVQAMPPTFVFFVNDAQRVHFTYERYLANKLREAFGFEGTPIRIIFRSREGAQVR